MPLVHRGKRAHVSPGIKQILVQRCLKNWNAEASSLLKHPYFKHINNHNLPMHLAAHQPSNQIDFEHCRNRKGNWAFQCLFITERCLCNPVISLDGLPGPWEMSPHHQGGGSALAHDKLKLRSRSVKFQVVKRLAWSVSWFVVNVYSTSKPRATNSQRKSTSVVALSSVQAYAKNLYCE